MAIAPAKQISGYAGIYVSDGAVAPTFEKLCGLTSATVTYAIESTTEFTEFCDEPESVPFQDVITTGKGITIAGQGVYNRTQAARLFAILNAGNPVDVEIRVSEAGAPAVAVYKWKIAGKFVLLSKEFTIGTNKEFIQQAISLSSTGVFTHSVLA